MKALKGLLESRDQKAAEADAILVAHEERIQTWKELPEESRGTEPEMSTEDAELIETRMGEIDEIDERIKDEKKAEKKRQLISEARSLIADSVIADASTDAAVVSEPMVYGEDSPFSYYQDLMRTAHGFAMPGSRQAMDRLATWAHQVEREVSEDTVSGKRAVESLRTYFHAPDKEARHYVREQLAEVRERGKTAVDQKEMRLEHAGIEQRSIVTGGGATATAASGGAAFVSPAIFLDPYAPYREYGRAFADQCNKQTLPDYGMEIYIPHVTGPAGVRQQTEGSAIQETDPTFGYLNAPVITLAGEVTVSQQQLDRAGPGFAFDRLIFDQLMRDYTPQWDTYVLNQALSGATTQTWSPASFDLITQNGSGGFYGQVSKAKASVRTTSGTVLNPRHLFMTPQRWEFIAGWGDNSYRPSVVADYAGPLNAVAGGSTDGDEGIEGVTGYRLNGLPVYTDANIPNNGTTTQDQAIVADLAEVFVYEGQSVSRVVPQTLAGSLLVLLQMYSYVAVLTRYTAGVVAITGTGMAAPSYTA